MPERAERKVFSEGLTLLNQRITRMAELSQGAVRKAIDGLSRRDAKECREVFALDREIYQYQREVDRECTDLIALHAPVARDLRTIMTTLKISTDIDRIGRGARNLAEVALELTELPPVAPAKLAKLNRNADLAIHMVDQAVRAFVERTDEGVRGMGRFDDAVDELHSEIFNDLIGGMEDGSLSPALGVRLALANRYVERIADHAVNIADRVVYLVSGQQPPWPESTPSQGPSESPAAPASSPVNPPPPPGTVSGSPPKAG
jgi:phosphate transport system protein